MKYGASDIMGSDKKGIDYNCGENNLYREGMDFDTVAKTDTLIEAMPKKQQDHRKVPRFIEKHDSSSLD